MWLWRVGKCDGPDELSLRGPALDPVSEINSWKLALQKTRCWAPVEMCRFDEASKTWTHHSVFLGSQRESISSWRISSADPLWTHRRCNRSQMVDTCQRWQVRKSDILQDGAAARSPFQWLLSEGTLSFALTNKDVYTQWQLCVGEWWLLSQHKWHAAWESTAQLQDRSVRITEQRVLRSACLCQHQLKAGILNPNKSLSTNSKELESTRLCAEQQGRDNCKQKYFHFWWIS